jgi:hypothetical protein
MLLKVLPFFVRNLRKIPHFSSSAKFRQDILENFRKILRRKFSFQPYGLGSTGTCFSTYLYLTTGTVHILA